MTTASAAPRVVHVERCMGTVFTIDIRDPGSWDQAIGAVVAWLHRADAMFSIYRAGSDISRIRRGELAVENAAPLLGEVLELCGQVQAETGGYFTPGWDGGPDPTGLVKGWAIERASHLLHCHGSHNHAINGGGDLQIAGEPAPASHGGWASATRSAAGACWPWSPAATSPSQPRALPNAARTSSTRSPASRRPTSPA